MTHISITGETRSAGPLRGLRPHLPRKTGEEKARPQAGFTLLEILVAMFIMALLSGVVVLSMPEGPESAEREARRLAARLHMAAQESVITGEAWGVVIGEDGYAFYRRRAGVWAPVGARDKFFAPETWDAETAVSWTREGVSPRLAELEDEREDEDDDKPKRVTPMARFDSTGEATPFEVVLERGRKRYTVRTDEMGEVALETGRL